MCVLQYLSSKFPDLISIAVFETRKQNNNADESQIRVKEKTFKSMN